MYHHLQKNSFWGGFQFIFENHIVVSSMVWKAMLEIRSANKALNNYAQNVYFNNPVASRYIGKNQPFSIQDISVCTWCLRFDLDCNTLNEFYTC